MRLAIFFLRCLLTVAGCAVTFAHAGDSAEILIQISMTAGLRYHEAKSIWNEMHAGDRLSLMHEPDNPYDAKAVRVEWRGHKLGYIPRTDNEAVARQLDRGNPIQARITKLTYYRNHRRKLEFEVFVPL